MTVEYVIPEDELIEEFIRPAAGPGGQHVNRTESGVRLHFPLDVSRTIPEDVRTRLRELAAGSITDGVLVVTAKESRSLKQNRATARRKMQQLVNAACIVPKVRKKTKPTRASVERRLASKARRSEVKRMRRISRDRGPGQE